MKSFNLLHDLWMKNVCPGDTVIDATLGAGFDTLFLAKLLKGNGRIFGYDIQKIALQKTEALLDTHLTLEEKKSVILRNQSHETFLESEASLIVYNLGYLPNGDKKITTKTETTIKSLQSALKIFRNMISIMTYVGHEEGEKEYIAIQSFLETLPKSFLVSKYSIVNRAQAPICFLLKNDRRVD